MSRHKGLMAGKRKAAPPAPRGRMMAIKGMYLSVLGSLGLRDASSQSRIGNTIEIHFFRGGPFPSERSTLETVPLALTS